METSSILNLYSNILHSASHIEDENMSFLWGEQPDVMNSRINFLSKFDLEPERSVMMSVVHGTEVAIIDESKLGLGMYEQQDALKVDALITNKPKINLCLLTADCLPISFYDPIKNIIAIAHAGWQGIDKKNHRRCHRQNDREFSN